MHVWIVLLLLHKRVNLRVTEGELKEREEEKGREGKISHQY